MQPSEIIQRLFDLGHFDNPSHPTGILAEDLSSLSLHDSVVRTALASYQEFMAGEFDALSYQEHNRRGITDGEMGPATARLLDLPRCGYPDYQRSGPEEANWPGSCRGQLRFGRSFASLPSMTQEQTDKAFIGACNNWSYALKDLMMRSDGRSEASGKHIYAGLKSLSGSTLAWSYLARNSCSVQLEQRYNTRVTWDLVLAITVATHEIGHAIGLPHNRDNTALMYPSIHRHSKARRGYPNATDLAQCRSVGYSLSGKSRPHEDDLYRPMPHDPDPPNPDPDPDPPTDDVWIDIEDGRLVVKQGANALRRFIITPSTEV